MSIKYSDSGFLDGADETKKLSFDVSGVTTGTTRTITMPDGDTKLYTGDGTSGQVLTSGGAGVAPTFQAAASGGATALDGLSDATTSATSNIGLGSGAVDSITTGDYNVGLGDNALTAITTGNWNTAIGHNALSVGTAALENVAIGYEALKNNTGNSNAAVGWGALASNTTGTQNSAFNYKSMNSNTIGSYNTAYGRESLRHNTTGNYNTAVGKDALTSNISAGQVTAVGYQALSQGTGIGQATAVGYQAGYNSNNRNELFGFKAGYSITSGYWNVCLGYTAEPTSATAHGQFTLGNNSIGNLRCNDTSISALSDQRDKADITDLPDTAGLELINKLRPVTYYWDRREWYEDGTPDGSKIKPEYRSWKANSGLKQGFIAQEVEAAISGEKCLEDSQVVNGTEDKKEFAPQHLLTNAIKAIQQLSAEVETLKAKVATLEGV